MLINFILKINYIKLNFIFAKLLKILYGTLYAAFFLYSGTWKIFEIFEIFGNFWNIGNTTKHKTLLKSICFSYFYFLDL